MKIPSITFNQLLVGVGVVLLTVFLLHLFGRGLHRYPVEPRWEVADADPDRGHDLIEQYGCAACHVVPGVRRARGRVGPQLRDFRNQVYIAGLLPNTPDNLIRWIRDPQAVSPGTAMPTLGLSEQEARDIAAYIYANP